MSNLDVVLASVSSSEHYSDSLSHVVNSDHIQVSHVAAVSLTGDVDREVLSSEGVGEVALESDVNLGFENGGNRVRSHVDSSLRVCHRDKFLSVADCLSVDAHDEVKSSS